MKTAKKLSVISRLLLLAGAILLGISAFFPWWGLDLKATMYPEGLSIIVHPDKLSGEIDILNTLNHYIGMKEISEEGFPELQYIPYVIWGLVAFLVLDAILGCRKLAYVICLLFLVGGALGVYDMYHWLHTFGTELDPDAPIYVDPFVPPVIGQNQLANFTTFSSFRIGFYFLVLSAFSVFVGTWGERLWAKKPS
ncbi:hypothetical protein [Calidifontibacillus oryziterrae]|uniref:hypothetical protein n=1 Tax=Calidifontibacillus oryziterrae TaxID=1191699 RepID=UPI0002F54F79|nr:hypothetical protein [Calidifontibacillus oryziterrae]